MELTGNVQGLIDLVGGGSDVEFEQILESGEKIGVITIDNVPTDIYAPEGAEVTVTQVLSSGTKIATIEVDGESVDLYAPPPPTQTEVEVTPIVTSGEHIADIEVNGVTSELYTSKSEIIYSTEERVIGTWMGKPLYIKSYHVSSISGTYTVIDSSINASSAKIRASEIGSFSVGGSYNGAQYVDGRMSSSTFARIMLINSGLQVGIENAPVEAITDFDFTIKYTKNAD